MLNIWLEVPIKLRKCPVRANY